MAERSSSVRDLLDRAGIAGIAGRGVSAARLYDEAAERCRVAGDTDGWTEAVLGAASVYVFGTDPGRLPAQLYDVLARTSDGVTRARLGAALARCWAYAGHASRAAQFADDALARAQTSGSPELVADCLDAALATHWGPDDLDVRHQLALRLDEVAAHVMDPETRLKAQLWGLQVACERLDVQVMHRQIRALEHLGEESARALFFAASRRLMLDLLRGRPDTSTELVNVASSAAEQAGLADSWMVLKAMTFYSAAFSGDTIVCSAGAAELESFGLSEGATAICAEAAFLWVCAARLDRAGDLVHTFHGPVLDELPRDVNWLLTLQCVLEASLAVGDREVIDTSARLLAPYEGRAVINAGAVMFHGVTDDTLARAAASAGDPDTALRLRTRALATYERLGAPWWLRRLAAWHPPVIDAEAGTRSRRVHLHPSPGGLWTIGREPDVMSLTALRGFGYLRDLLRRPHQHVLALDLVGAGQGVLVEDGVGQILDTRAMREYRQRLQDLDRELDEAHDWADLGRVETIQSERDALLHELGHATGMAGRIRPTGSSSERARVAVRKAISTAIDRIGTADETLGSHLRATIRTGLNCSYEPTVPAEIEWVLD